MKCVKCGYEPGSVPAWVSTFVRGQFPHWKRCDEGGEHQFIEVKR